MAAGLTVMQEMKPQIYEQMADLGRSMRKELRTILDEEGVEAHVGGVGSLFHITWTEKEVIDFRSATTSARFLNVYFNLEMMNRGIFKLGHPNVSAVTTANEVNTAIEAARETIRTMKPLIKERAPNLCAAR
jgi:glutamate-1-semialdehyde aminotransferase